MNTTRTIFVFGSNALGMHGGGAARYAYDRLGAEWGVGEGLTGDTYALPTKHNFHSSYTLEQLNNAVASFIRFAECYPSYKFHLTKVGCGLAGFDEVDVSSMFLNAPVNVVMINDAGEETVLARDWFKNIGNT